MHVHYLSLSYTSLLSQACTRTIHSHNAVQASLSCLFLAHCSPPCVMITKQLSTHRQQLTRKVCTCWLLEAIKGMFVCMLFCKFTCMCWHSCLSGNKRQPQTDTKCKDINVHVHQLFPSYTTCCSASPWK